MVKEQDEFESICVTPLPPSSKTLKPIQKTSQKIPHKNSKPNKQNPIPHYVINEAEHKGRRD